MKDGLGRDIRQKDRTSSSPDLSHTEWRLQRTSTNSNGQYRLNHTNHGHGFTTEVSAPTETIVQVDLNCNFSIDEETMSMSDLSDQAQTPILSTTKQKRVRFNQLNSLPEKVTRYGKPSSWKHFAFQGLKILVACLAVLGLLSLFTIVGSNQRVHSHEMASPSVSPQICDCGASTAEARALGCQFVEMSAAWLPPRCIDSALSAEFDRSGPGPNGAWSYYSDAARRHPLTISEVALFADTQQIFYSTWEWHAKHCTFQWRLDYRRRWLDTIIEPRYDHESHVTHCEDIFLGERESSVGSIVRLNSSNHLPKEHLHHEHGQHDLLHD